MREVRGNTWCIDNIIQGELIDEWACFEQQRQRLSDRDLGQPKLLEFACHLR